MRRFAGAISRRAVPGFLADQQELRPFSLVEHSGAVYSNSFADGCSELNGYDGPLKPPWGPSPDSHARNHDLPLYDLIVRRTEIKAMRFRPLRILRTSSVGSPSHSRTMLSPSWSFALAEACPFRGAFRLHYSRSWPHVLRQTTGSGFEEDRMESARRVPCPRAKGWRGSVIGALP